MSIPTKFLLPHGRYRCSLTARQAITQPSVHGDRMALELQAVVTDGPHAGHPLKFRVFGEAKMQRARRLRGGESFVAAVTQVVLESGVMVNRVVDFQAARDVSVIEVADGYGPGTCGEDHSLGVPQEEALRDIVALLRVAIGRGSAAASVTVGQETVPLHPRPTFADDYTIGFHRAGSKGGQRDLVEHDHVLGLYSACDPAVATGGPGYLGLYQYGGDIEDHRRANEGSLAGYRGRCWARWLAIDLDGDGTDSTLDKTLEDARSIVRTLLALGVPAGAVAVFFSGRRGVHILWPSGVLAATPKDGFEGTVGLVCEAIARLCGVTIDPNLYKPLASLRAPNTRHEDTGLYKVLLPAGDLKTLDAAAVKELAKEPRPFVMPDWAARPVMALHDAWRMACGVDAGARRRAVTVTSGEPRIFSGTFEVMVHGAPEGSRGTRFFNAAMNLLDFDCPEPLLHALLEPAARLSGYPMNEFQAQIDGAIKAHAGPGTACA
jgi:hypothetical protein